MTDKTIEEVPRWWKSGKRATWDGLIADRDNWQAMHADSQKEYGTEYGAHQVTKSSLEKAQAANQRQANRITELEAQLFDAQGQLERSMSRIMSLEDIACEWQQVAETCERHSNHYENGWRNANAELVETLFNDIRWRQTGPRQLEAPQLGLEQRSTVKGVVTLRDTRTGEEVRFDSHEHVEDFARLIAARRYADCMAAGEFAVTEPPEPETLNSVLDQLVEDGILEKVADYEDVAPTEHLLTDLSTLNPDEEE